MKNLMVILFLFFAKNLFAESGPVYNFQFNNYPAGTNPNGDTKSMQVIPGNNGTSPAAVNQNITDAPPATNAPIEKYWGVTADYWMIKSPKMKYNGIAYGLKLPISSTSSIIPYYVSGGWNGNQNYNKNESENYNREWIDETNKLKVSGLRLDYIYENGLGAPVSTLVGLSFNYLKSLPITEGTYRVWDAYEMGTFTYSIKSLTAVMGPSINFGQLIKLSLKLQGGYALETREGDNNKLTGTTKNVVYGGNIGLTINI